MLTKLIPEQISNFWDVIQYAIEQSLPPTVGETPDKMNKILSACLSGKVDVWASYNKSDKNIKFEGIVLTKVLFDEVSQTKSFLIYCLYGYEDVDKTSWVDGFEMLKKYAVSRECSKIIGYTEYDYIAKIVNKLGGESRYRFISFNIGG